MALNLADECMLRALTKALDANPFADPVLIGDAELSRASAREAERRLWRLRSAGRHAA